MAETDTTDAPTTTKQDDSAWAQPSTEDQQENSSLLDDDLLRFQQQQEALEETVESQPEDNNTGTEHKQSLPDRLTGAALSTTLEILKQVGGVTLSTTGALVAPPLHVTKTILLPQLFLALKDYLKSAAPERLQDWFRIFQSCFYHVHNSLIHSSAGHSLRRQLLLFWLDVVDLISCDLCRQLVVDSASTIVKFSEVLHTPQTKLWLDQWIVALCRFVDVVGDGRNKLLLHSWKQTVWKFCELVADPTTTTALAEVTAYFCYALEMEELKATPKNNRKVREQYQKATELDRQRLSTPHATTTVEEAILSSLGMPGLDGTDDDNSSLVTDWEGSSSIKQQIMDDDSTKKDERHETTRKKIDKQFLRDGIEERAVRAQKRKHEVDQADDLNTTIQDASVTSVDEPGTSNVQCTLPEEPPVRRPRVQVENASVVTQVPPENVVGFGSVDDTTKLPPPSARERRGGESSLEHFYRILDEVLDVKRNQAVQDAVEKDTILSGKPTSRRPDASDDLTGTLKERLAAIRNQLKRQQSLSKREPTVRWRRKYALLLVLFVILGVLALWVGLGCYGLYILLQPSLGQSQARRLGSPPTTNEIVVRVVREVVHVDSSGKVLGKGADAADLGDSEYRKVAECIAESYN